MNGEKILCPVHDCDWTYVVEPIDPRALSPGALAAVFGPGIVAAHALNQQARRAEDAIEQHLRGHTTLEFVQTIQLRTQERDEAHRALEYVESRSS